MNYANSCSISKSSNKSNFFINFFYNLFSHISKCLKIYQLNIIKIKKPENKKAGERYQSISKEEKLNKEQYGGKRYKNLPENEKQKLVE